MSRYVFEAVLVVLTMCVLIRVADLLLSPVLPLLVVAIFLVGVGWLVLGRPRSL